MLKYLFAFLLLLTSHMVLATEWVSPIDTKYTAKNPALFEKFDTARALLDSWGGQKELLQEADKLLRQILEEDHEYAPAYREYGRLYIMAGYVRGETFKDGSLNPAEKTILKSLEIEPEYADSYVLLGHLYTQMRRYDEAERALNKAEKIGTETPWFELNWADLWLKRRALDVAQQHYQQVIDKGTTNRKAYAKALSGITKIHRYKKEYKQANQAYQRELEYSPKDAWLHGNYAGFLLFSYDDVDGAIKEGRTALGIMDYGMGRFILASALYTKWAVLRENPASVELAQVYFDEARELYPNAKDIIDKTQKHPYTVKTALSLMESLADANTRY